MTCMVLEAPTGDVEGVRIELDPDVQCVSIHTAIDAASYRVYQYTPTEPAMSRIDHSTRTRDVLKALAADGWTVARKGPGDHVQYRHPTKPGRVTIDTGAREIPTGTLRSIYRQAGWAW